MDWNRLKDKAQAAIAQRGGIKGLKAEGQELRDIAKGDGTFQDKARRARRADTEQRDQATGPEPPPAGPTPPSPGGPPPAATSSPQSPNHDEEVI